MTFPDTVVLATSAIVQPELGTVPARTLLVGAAALTVRSRFGAFGFDLTAHSTSASEDRDGTLGWLVERLASPARLMIWRAEDIVVPSLIAACDSARDTLGAARLLRELDRAFDGDVVDVAIPHGGSRATSFDAVAHAHSLPFVPLAPRDLKTAQQTSHHGLIREHLATRVTSMWRLWLLSQPDGEAVTAATDAWVAEGARGPATTIVAA